MVDARNLDKIEATINQYVVVVAFQVKLNISLINLYSVASDTLAVKCTTRSQNLLY
jgi:hypothetical protein